MIPVTCEKCGAPLNHKMKCDFCGTYYCRDTEGIEVMLRSGIDADDAMACTGLKDTYDFILKSNRNQDEIIKKFMKSR